MYQKPPYIPPSIGAIAGDLVQSFYASTFYERLETQVHQLSEGLPDDELLNVSYVDPSGNRFFVQDISYHNPTLLILTCRDKDLKENTIFAHVFSVSLIVEKVKNDNVKRPSTQKRIGFRGEVGN